MSGIDNWRKSQGSDCVQNYFSDVQCLNHQLLGFAESLLVATVNLVPFHSLPILH